MGGSDSTITFSNVGSAKVEFRITQAQPHEDADIDSVASSARILDLSTFTATGADTDWVLRLFEAAVPQTFSFSGNKAATAGLLVAWIRTQAGFTAALSGITVPTLVCLAHTPAERDAEVLAAVTTATVEVHEGATHFMHLLDPDRFAERIAVWALEVRAGADVE